jgi:hypothetical protein
LIKLSRALWVSPKLLKFCSCRTGTKSLQTLASAPLELPFGPPQTRTCWRARPRRDFTYPIVSQMADNHAPMQRSRCVSAKCFGRRLWHTETCFSEANSKTLRENLHFHGKPRSRLLGSRGSPVPGLSQFSVSDSVLSISFPRYIRSEGQPSVNKFASACYHKQCTVPRYLRTGRTDVSLRKRRDPLSTNQAPRWTASRPGVPVANLRRLHSF